jgi:hypothetical protein
VRVLASRRFPGPAWDELGDVEYLDEPLEQERPDVVALAVVAEPVDEARLELLPNLLIAGAASSSPILRELRPPPPRTSPSA